MGFTVEILKVYNPEDMIRLQRNEITIEQVRQIETPALVDTGAWYCGLHKEHIEALGLHPGQTIPIRTAGGPAETRLYTPGPVLELLGRQATLDIIEVGPDVPALIGVTLLQQLVLIVDPNSQRVIPDPAWGGERVHWVLYHGAA